jgi:antitoxin MazE
MNVRRPILQRKGITIVRVGNSKGIRIPKTLPDEAELPEEVELHAERGRIIVRAARHARSDWSEAAKGMHARGDDALLDEPTPTKYDREGWK